MSMKGFPLRKLAAIAIIDTLGLGGLVISAYGVTPAMTVILMQAHSPVSVLGCKYFFPDRLYTPTQIKGVWIVCVALFLGVFSAFFSPGYDDRSTVASSALYIACASLQGLSTLFKEKSVLEFGTPVDMYTLSSALFSYQVVFSIILFPFFYLLQGKKKFVLILISS